MHHNTKQKQTDYITCNWNLQLINSRMETKQKMKSKKEKKSKKKMHYKWMWFYIHKIAYDLTVVFISILCSQNSMEFYQYETIWKSEAICLFVSTHSKHQRVFIYYSFFLFQMTPYKYFAIGSFLFIQNSQRIIFNQV